MNLNKTQFIGKLEDDPQITVHPTSKKKQAFFNLAVTHRVQNANGQFVDQITSVPCYASDKVAEAIGNHVKKNQEIYIEAYYRNWELNNVKHHGMIVMNQSFGYRPREQN